MRCPGNASTAHGESLVPHLVSAVTRLDIHPSDDVSGSDCVLLQGRFGVATAQQISSRYIRQGAKLRKSHSVQKLQGNAKPITHIYAT